MTRYISQRGQLKRSDHADLRYKCRTYARLLQHLRVGRTNTSKHDGIQVRKLMGVLRGDLDNGISILCCSVVCSLHLFLIKRCWVSILADVWVDMQLENLK